MSRSKTQVAAAIAAASGQPFREPPRRPFVPPPPERLSVADAASPRPGKVTTRPKNVTVTPALASAVDARREALRAAGETPPTWADLLRDGAERWLREQGVEVPESGVVPPWRAALSAREKSTR